MANGTQEEVPLSKLIDAVAAHIDPKELDFYSPTKDFVIEAPAEKPETAETVEVSDDE
jgi:hypothetical protein